MQASSNFESKKFHGATSLSNVRYFDSYIYLSRKAHIYDISGSNIEYNSD